MCSQHHLFLKKIQESFTEIIPRLGKDSLGTVLMEIKRIKQRGMDEFNMLEDCNVKDKYLKVLNAPIPPTSNPAIMSKYLDEVVKGMH